LNCRHCAAPLSHTFLDLGFAPPSNAYLTAADLAKPEKYFPLRVKVCDQCWLVQTEDHAQANELLALIMPTSPAPLAAGWHTLNIMLHKYLVS